LAVMVEIDTNGPKIDNLGRIIYDHAQEIPYSEGASRWQERINQIELTGGNSSHQVVVIPTNDLTEKLSHLDSYPFADKYPVAIAKVGKFPDTEDLDRVENEVPGVKHITIIASPTTYADLFHIAQTADHYKEVLNTNHVTLFVPYLMTTRQDKNINSRTGEYEPVSINIHSTINALSGSIDSFIVMEPHSFATQTEAAKRNRALFPVTPWRFLMNEATRRTVKIDGKKFWFTKENTLNVRPDIGRNIAATRSADYYGLEHISFDKKRISPTKTDLSLSVEDQKRVKDMMCVVYDDELETCGTIGTMAEKLTEYQAMGLVIVAVHGKFTGEWKKNIASPMIRKIFISDSFKPIGNIEPYIKSGKIEVISLTKNIKEIIEADLKGVNFWLDPNYSHMVLQTNGQDEKC